jgi:hypothetical protein
MVEGKGWLPEEEVLEDGGGWWRMVEDGGGWWRMVVDGSGWWRMVEGFGSSRLVASWARGKVENWLRTS